MKSAILISLVSMASINTYAAGRAQLLKQTADLSARMGMRDSAPLSKMTRAGLLANEEMSIALAAVESKNKFFVSSVRQSAKYFLNTQDNGKSGTIHAMINSHDGTVERFAFNISESDHVPYSTQISYNTVSRKYAVPGDRIEISEKYTVNSKNIRVQEDAFRIKTMHLDADVRRVDNNSNLLVHVYPSGGSPVGSSGRIDASEFGEIINYRLNNSGTRADVIVLDGDKFRKITYSLEKQTEGSRDINVNKVSNEILTAQQVKKLGLIGIRKDIPAVATRTTAKSTVRNLEVVDGATK